MSLIKTAGFRSMMSTFPTGVAVVTTRQLDGKPRGMTCSSVCSVTLEPPTLLVCLGRGSPTLHAILRQSTFAVNLLHEAARPTAELFASGNADRFNQIAWRCEPSLGGPHLIDDAHAIADCKVTRTVSIGDHTVVFGEVFQVEQKTSRQPTPLLYGLRQYSCWSSSRQLAKQGEPG